MKEDYKRLVVVRLTGTVIGILFMGLVYTLGGLDAAVITGLGLLLGYKLTEKYE